MEEKEPLTTWEKRALIAIYLLSALISIRVVVWIVGAVLDLLT